MSQSASELREFCSARPDQECGSMSVEMVILTPVLVLFLLLVAACGRYIDVKGDLEATTRDAARAASLERSSGAASTAAADMVAQGLPDAANCTAATVDFRPPLENDLEDIGWVRVSMSCTVSYDSLGLIGLPGTATLTTVSSAPLDRYRRLDNG